jgi:hypothetical protein
MAKKAMVRKNLFMTQQQWVALETIAELKDTSASELIRRAIQAMLAEEKSSAVSKGGQLCSELP